MINWLIKNKKIVIIASVVFIFGLVFISIPIGVFPDSLIYYGYTRIFQGVDPISSWNLLRGPSFPFILYLFITCFGGAMVGLLIGAYVVFLSMIYALHKVLNYFINHLKLDRKTLILVYGLLVILVVINPIVFGYFHALLTEYIVMLLAVLSCIGAWLWTAINFIANKRKYILLSIFFIVLMPFVWFIKQPYITIAIFPWAIAAVISIIKNFTLNNIMQRFATLSLGVGSLMIAIFAWQIFLVGNGVNINSNSGSSGFISYGLINGVSDAKLMKESQITEEHIGSNYLTDSDRDSIRAAMVDSKLNVNLWVLYDISGSKVIDEVPVYFNSDDIQLSVSFGMWSRMVAEHPLSVLDSYLTNYLATSNFYDYGISDNGQWAPNKRVGLYGHENKSIGLMFLTYPFNMSNWTNYEGASRLGLVQIENKHVGLRDFIFNIFGKPYLVLYIVFSILLPLAFALSIFKYIKLRRLGSSVIAARLFEMVVILLGFSLFNMLFNVFFGSLMDRYSYVAWPCISLAVILFAAYLVSGFGAKNSKKSIAKNKSIKR